MWEFRGQRSAKPEKGVSWVACQRTLLGWDINELGYRAAAEPGTPDRGKLCKLARLHHHPFPLGWVVLPPREMDRPRPIRSPKP